MYSLATKALHLLPPETAHDITIKILQWLPVYNVIKNLDLQEFSQDILGMHFKHPIGLAAGFDKHAEVFNKLGQLGFSFVEVGSITPKPQYGNPKPRLFRLTEHQAIINRYGFNSKGLEYAANQLQKQVHTCITGINLGKNKDTSNDAEDFLKGAEKLINQADYFTVNVSSPNTPGLRDLQTATALLPIITGIRQIMQQHSRTIPLFIKVSPDMSLEQETTLFEFLTEQAIDGIIISNTTTRRIGVETHLNSAIQGGLSGPPLRALSNAMLQRAYKITRGRVILMGCGGISSGKDIYEKLCAGANLVQLYTAFVYQGPSILKRVLLELKMLLVKNGIKNITEIIGSNPIK